MGLIDFDSLAKAKPNNLLNQQVDLPKTNQDGSKATEQQFLSIYEDLLKNICRASD